MRPKRISGATSRSLPEGDTVVVDASNANAVVLNGMGGVVWELCDGEHTVEDMVRLICTVFTDVFPHTVRDDVQRFVAMLHERGLLSDSSGV